MNNHAQNSESIGSSSSRSGPRLPSSSAAPSPSEAALTSPSPRWTLLDDRLTLPKNGSSSPPPLHPRIVGKYAILEEVQVGGMGIVCKARDTELDRIVALKTIKNGLLATDEEIARFRREARAIAALDHPNIVPLYEIGQDNGCLYFTMAFAWGGSLTQCHNRLAADPRAAAALLETIARAVHYAHQHGILHRDLKPGNILFDERDTPWVADFGLAKFVDASLELTHTEQLLGTPAYMAPEQASGQTAQISPQTDVWALGVILYELLTGKRPFAGKTREEQLRRVQTTDPPRPRLVKRSLDRALETVILKCLEKEPARRYPSAEALADDLARWLRSESVLARPPSWTTRTGRALRRYHGAALRLAFAFLLLVLLGLVLKGNSSPPAIAPDRPEDRTQRQALEEKLAPLKRGEKVPLLGKSGPPVWERWQPRRGNARTMVDMNQVFHVFANKQPGLLELLPAAPTRYRLSAQVRHVSSRRDGSVGIYFAHGRRPTEKGATHCFFRVAFNDRDPLPIPLGKDSPPDNQVRLTWAIYLEEKKGFAHFLDNTCGISQAFSLAGKVEPMPWRTLEVEVTPDWIRTFWEGKPIETAWWGKQADGIDPNKVLEQTCFVLRGRGGRSKDPILGHLVRDAELELGRGIGLYVDNGTAAFRSVVIEPLYP